MPTKTPPSGLPAISPSGGEITHFDVCDWLISPLEGEMSGRTEGGVPGGLRREGYLS